MYRVLRPRLIATQEIDAQVQKQNEEIYEKNNVLISQNNILIEQNNQLQLETNQIKNENDKLLIQKDAVQEQINTLNNSLTTIEKQAQEAADLFYNSKLEIAQENLALSLEAEAKKYQDNVAQFEKEYNDTVNEMLSQYKSLADNVATMKVNNDAAVAAAKRAEEMKNQQDYYRIQLTPADIHEIELLRSVEPYLRDKEPLNKVIWKCYYEKPTTDMIGRVVGSGIHTGIYKITEIATGKCYVGQAANISDRWKQHIKRGEIGRAHV